jgi:hypothetical protein
MVSEIQERQMTTILDANIHNIAIKGTFDDGQGHSNPNPNPNPPNLNQP